MRIIDEKLLNEVSTQAKESPRLRMNYNFHSSLQDKCHRMLNAVEPGTVIPIHRHPTNKDDGSVIESAVLCVEEGRYGVDIPRGVWHRLESLARGSVVFECKAGVFLEHEVEGVLELPQK